MALMGCSSPGEPGGAEGDGRPMVLTTFTVLADMAQNVAGEQLQVASITEVGAEIHGYEPTPSDIRTAAEADLILDNGLGLEAWFEQFLAEIDAPRAVVSSGVDTIELAAGADAGEPNPHAWMSPVNAAVYLDNIVAAFSELDPQNAQVYAENAERYTAEVEQVHHDLLAELEEVPESQRALVTCEGAFPYLARDAGLTERYLWPVNAEGEATAQQITEVIEFVQANEVPAVFCESTVSDAQMRQVIEATDTEFGGVLYVDSLSEPAGPVPTYLDLLRHDAEVIAAALGAP
ncbi:MAG TPA: metal ABC transporter substrate-binding protein [Beutenbergiaceae bacterium]|nr:metal ABC transporter substrate-binding protein [Beutenbergiaceae bacterium]